MSTMLYGPNGDPIHVQGGRVLPQVGGELAVAHRAAVDTTIEKTVRSRAVSYGTTWDKARGKPKPTPVTDEVLRLMANRNEWVRAILKTRKNQLGRIPWDITVKDADDPSGAAAKAAKAMRKMLQRPSMHGSQPHSRSWRNFLGMYLEDLLVLDRGVIEKERDGRGWIIALYPVDGATIRPNMDERGAYLDDAYVQLVDGQIEARFGMEELICTMDNEQTDVRFAGYGMSPLEHLIVTVTAELHASKYNANYFEKGAVPEGMISLGEDASPEDVDAFRLYWSSEIQGRPWAVPIIGGSKDPEWMQWRDSHRDMQFMEYQSWLLQKLCAVYQISKQDLGELEDVNRATADSQETSGREKGVEPLMAVVKDMIDLEVIGEHGQGLGDYLEFTWEQQGESAEEINAKFQPMVNSGAATRKEWRDAHGLGDPDGQPHGHEGLEMHLADGTPQPLPSSSDVEHMGAAAEQQRAKEQAEREPGPAVGVPWQPADGEHPDTQQAMAQHDEDTGIGPRQGGPAVGKVAPAAHDRNPALTQRTDRLEDVFAQATARLVDGLAAILTDPKETQA